jgi:hypothetical protein
MTPAVSVGQRRRWNDDIHPDSAEITGGFMVSNHFSSYPVFIPEGGSYEIREWVER